MLVGTGSLKHASATHTSQSIVAFPEGARVQICSLSGDRQICLRLESMGLVSGNVVQILKRRGAGLLLKTEYTRIAIRLSPAFHLEATYAGA